MKAHTFPKVPVEEYVQQEIESSQKYEFHDGRIFAMAGDSVEHALLIGNIYAELRNRLKEIGSNCKPITSEAKLFIEKNNKYVYPDTMVICGVFERSELYKDAVSNPVLLVEVLSKSTAEYDRNDKFYFYRQIPSLREYVLIEQERYIVEVYFKKENTDLWNITRYTGLDQTIKLQSLEIEINMKDLYFDIRLEDTFL